MEPILVYGFPLGSSMGLLAALEWLGQPYKLTRVDMLGEMKTPAFARLNPRQETPALITNDGRVLTETMAIAAWLEARDGERRISFDSTTVEADRMHQLAAFLNTGFTGAFTPLWAAMEGDMPEADKVVLRAFGAQQVRKRHDQLETMLGDTPYLVGDRPTLADGVFIGVARWLEFHELAEPGRWPRIESLRATIEGDPSVQFAEKLEQGQPITGRETPPHIELPDLIATYGGAI